MKRIAHTPYRLLHTLVLLMVALLTACSDDIDEPAFSTGPINVKAGSVVLSLAAPRTASELTEADVDVLDVLIFLQEEDGKVTPRCVFHRRYAAADLQGDDGSRYVVLGHTGDFLQDRKYIVYVLANTHADATSEADTYTEMQQALDKCFPLESSHANPSEEGEETLKNFVYTTRKIHLSGDKNNFPNRFLMDGIAYTNSEESDITFLTLNSGEMFATHTLYVTLCRAAAKVTVTLTADPDNHYVMLPEPGWIPNQPGTGNPASPSDGQTRYDWHPMNQREDTYLVAHTDDTGNNAFPADPDLKSHTPTTYNITVNPGLGNTARTSGTYTAVTYSYGHDWEKTDSEYENTPYLIVRVPLIYCSEGIPESFNPATVDWTKEDENSSDRYIATVPVSDDAGNKTTRTLHYYVANYYKIPMGMNSRMNRNTHYYVTGTLKRPGSTTADSPTTLPDITFKVVEWTPVTIEAGGDAGIHYLLVNKKEYSIRNVSEDHTLTFTSSHPVRVEVKEVWYDNKEGKRVDLLDQDGNIIESVQVGTNDGNDITKPINIEVSAKADEGLSGNIHLTSTNPDNNLLRHIKLLVTNEAGDREEVIIHQYPLDYIVYTPGVYSYFDYTDFSTFEWRKLITENTTPNRYYTGASRGTGVGQWTGRTGKTETNTQVLFHPKYRTQSDTIYTYFYNENKGGNLERGFKREGWTDYRMYHIQITSTSTDYTLARPKLDAEGHTVFGAENARRVSPSFMINSQLGGSSNDVANYQAINPDAELQWAHSFADHYAEVYRDKNGQLRVYRDWRLPTPAEIKIIMKFQGTDANPSEAMFVVMNGRGYWSSNGHETNTNYPDASDNCIRLVRDVYDEDDMEGEPVGQPFTGLSGYLKYTGNVPD